MADQPIAVSKFKVEEVLDWELYKESLRQKLVDEAGYEHGGDEKLGETWWGEVVLVGDEFEVRLHEGEP